MFFKALALGKLQIEDHHVQLALRRDLRVLLPERPRGGVARVGEQRLAGDLALGVEGGEGAFRHIDLAAHDQVRQFVRQRHGQVPDGADVLRHVLPRAPVAAGRAADKTPVAILDGNGQPVYLWLDAVLHGVELLAHTLVELADLVRIEHVLQALQRHLVLHRGKAVGRGAAHVLGRRIRRDLLRVRRLQILQLAQQVVVLIVRHHRRVHVVVELAVVFENFPQFLDACLVIHVLFSYPFRTYSSAVPVISSEWKYV